MKKTKTTIMKKLLLIIIAFVGTLFGSFAQTDLIISEYVEGWSNNKALEIYNPTNGSIELDEYRVTRYSNGADVPPADNQWTINLPSFTLKPYSSYVVVLDKRDPAGTGQEAPVWKQLQERADVFLCPVYTTSKAMYFNGNDAVALEKTNGTLVDLFARWGAPNPAPVLVGGSTLSIECWTDTSPYFTGLGVGITADHTMVKKASINTGVITNPSIWNPLADWDTLPANTFSGLGWHKSNVAPANATPVFDKNQYLYSVESTSENGLEIGTLTTTDAEGDAIRYFINYGNFVYINNGTADVRIEPFAIGKTDGKLTLIDKTGLDPTVKDTFDIKVMATDGFSQTNEILVRVLVDIEIGVSENELTHSVSIFPNPSVDKHFNVVSNNLISSISVTNVLGQEIFNQRIENSNTASINIPNASMGVYQVFVKNVDGTTLVKNIIFK